MKVFLPLRQDEFVGAHVHLKECWCQFSRRTAACRRAGGQRWLPPGGFSEMDLLAPASCLERTISIQLQLGYYRSTHRRWRFLERKFFPEPLLWLCVHWQLVRYKYNKRLDAKKKELTGGWGLFFPRRARRRTRCCTSINRVQ